MSRKPDDLVDDYLKRLRRELRGLPRAARRDVLDEISTHIAQSRAELETDDEAGIRSLLHRLGDPADIAADARERLGVTSRKRSWVEVTALFLLSIGSLIPLVGWLAGAILLWVSDVWTTRDKLLGTAFVPGGLGGLWFFAQTLSGTGQGCLDQTCSGTSSGFGDVFWPVLLLGMAVATIATTIYLALRLRSLSRRAALA